MPAPLPPPFTNGTRTPSPASAASAAAPRVELPKWAVEEFFDRIGRGTSAAGAALDRAAGLPVLSFVIRPLSSVWLGLLWIFLIGSYVAIGSGVSSIRAYFEMTDLEFFDAWPMRILLVLMCATIIVVTLRRIPLTLFKLGVWTVHVGILVLVLGCVLYFSQKVEGLTRIHINQAVNAFYDDSERSLYVYKLDDDKPVQETMIPLPGLPIYHEYLKATGNPLDRAIPPDALAKLDPALASVPVRIVGYYPYAWRRPAAYDGPPPTRPVSQPASEPASRPASRLAYHGIAISAAGGGILPRQEWEWLSEKPALRHVSQGRFDIEYLRNPSLARVASLMTDFDGPLAVMVRIPKLQIARMIPLSLNRRAPIPIPGTPYTITPGGPAEELPLVSDGYEGAHSDAYWFTITKTEGQTTDTWDRDVIEQFPDMSMDFRTDSGRPVRQKTLIDPDIELEVHTAMNDQFWVLQAPTGQLTLIHRARGGQSEMFSLSLGTPRSVQVGPATVAFTVIAETDNALPRVVGGVVPPEFREGASSVSAWIKRGAIAVEVGTGETMRPLFLPFVEYADPAGPNGVPPQVVHIPGVGPVGFLLSSTRRPLPTSVRLNAFEFVALPGTQQAADFRSSVTFTTAGRSHDELINLNNPANADGYHFFQAEWDGDPDANPSRRFTVLGVGNRPGIYTLIAGSLLIFLGIIYGFYIKPILQTAKIRQLAQWRKEAFP